MNIIKTIEKINIEAYNAVKNIINNIYMFGRREQLKSKLNKFNATKYQREDIYQDYIELDYNQYKNTDVLALLLKAEFSGAYPASIGLIKEDNSLETYDIILVSDNQELPDSYDFNTNKGVVTFKDANGKFYSYKRGVYV